MLSGMVLAATLLFGCSHPPKAYVPKNATEQAVLAYAKTKAPDLVVINILSPNIPAAEIPLIFGKTGIPYSVTLASAEDGTMQTSLLVPVDTTTLQPVERADTPLPAPLVKVEPLTK